MKMGMNPVVLGMLARVGTPSLKPRSAPARKSRRQLRVRAATPDDRGYPAGQLERIQYRARPNVIVVLGMVLGHLTGKRVAIFYEETVELPSDMNGVFYVPFKERVDEQASMLFRVLDEAGYRPSKGAF